MNYLNYKCKHLPEDMNMEKWMTGVGDFSIRTERGDKEVFRRYYEVKGVHEPIFVTYTWRKLFKKQYMQAGNRSLKMKPLTCGCVNKALRMIVDMAIEDVLNKSS